jgi:hypothetical protein
LLRRALQEAGRLPRPASEDVPSSRQPTAQNSKS